MSNFMRIFEAKALAKALTDAGHSTSERTAQRWKAEDTRPKPQDVRAIRELVGAMLPDTTKEAAPPKWAERLLAGVMALEAKADVSDADKDHAVAAMAAWVATLEQQKRRRRGGGGAGGASNA